jgi:HSP20 family protein
MNKNERNVQRTGEQSGERAVGRWDPSFASRDPFERLFRLAGFGDEGFGGGLRQVAVAPSIDVEEDDDSYEVTVELPGMKQDDVEVELNQNVLTIRGEKRYSSNGGDKERKRRTRWSERSYGRFVRSFTLPSDADADRLQAKFSNGVLTITIPKSEASKPRVIDVKGELGG